MSLISGFSDSPEPRAAAEIGFGTWWMSRRVWVWSGIVDMVEPAEVVVEAVFSGTESGFSPSAADAPCYDVTA